MTLKVDPEALRAYAARLSEALASAEAAERYVKAHGMFSFHQTGLIGYFAPYHHSYVEALGVMLAQIARVADASEQSMKGIAGSYEEADSRSAEAVDDSYPVTARPSPV